MTNILLKRTFDLLQGPQLYHYCSAATFQAICDYKTIRFSDINMMNDFSEMRYAYRIFEQAATELISTDIPGVGRLPKEFFDKIDSIIAPQQLKIHPVIACFSLNGDILSQWSRYGADGKGLSLGFSGTALKALPVTAGKVIYDTAAQIEEMKVALGTIFLQDRDHGGGFGSEAAESTQLLGAEMAFIKHPAFAEEQEVRLLHLLDVHLDEDRWWLSDEGGESQGASVAGEPVRFRLSDETVIAYIDLKVRQEHNVNFIREIKLGPKNRNGPGNLLYLAGAAGLKSLKISQSDCPYR